MRNSPDISLARFLMILSMVLLAVLEYLWLHNEYKNSYRDMEDKLNHVMFSSVRDIEDSLLFSKLSLTRINLADDDKQPVTVMIQRNDSSYLKNDCNPEKRTERSISRRNPHHEMRGVLLKRLSRMRL